MSKTTPTLEFCAVNPVTLSAEQAGGAWIKLLPAGTLPIRDGRGPFHAGDKKNMQAIIDRTKAYLGGTEMMIDYDHQSVFGAVKGVGGTAKAAGWVKEYDIRDDGIYGRVEWTRAAKDAIEAGEYRYISPTFISDKRTGRVTQLLNAALLNQPAMDLTAVAAHTLLNPQEGQTMDEILEALGLAEGSGEAEILAAITAMQESRTAAAAAAGLGEDATAENIVTAIADLAKTAKAGKPDPAKFVPIAQVTALQAEIQSLRADMDAGKAEAAVAAAIEGGKVAPALKDWALDLAKSDMKAFEAFTASAPTLTHQQLGNKKTKDGAGNGELSDSDLQVMSQMGLTKDEFIAARTEETEV